MYAPHLDALLQMSAPCVEMYPARAYRPGALEVVRRVLDSVATFDTGTPLCGDIMPSQVVEPAQLERLRRILEAAPAVDDEAVAAAPASLETLEARCR